MEPDFSGYVTKANLKCTDGRTIAPSAFAHQDGMTVPLVYQHNHKDINQVLGKVTLSKRDDGVWGDVYLNETVSAQNARMAVKNGDIDKFSVWAKDLEEQGFLVHDGVIQEVSLVLAGANPGAQIYNVLAHGQIDPDDLMFVGGEIMHDDTPPADKPEDKPADNPPADNPPADKADRSVGEVLETLDDDQRTAVNAFMDEVVTNAVTQALSEDQQLTHDNLDSPKGNNMPRNVFDRTDKQSGGTAEFKHSDAHAILALAKGPNGEGGSQAASSLRDLVRSSKGKELMHADTYGVENLEILFPDAKKLMNTPTWVDRRQEWVKTFMNGVGKSPFSRVKTMHADITADEARARGYIKGNRKVEEVFPVFKRTTGPAWIYKKQKLDRQDIIDITDFDVVAWIKAEMRGKLDEEIARAALFGDRRPAMIGGEMNPDKIQDPGPDSKDGNGIRAIVNENDLYVTTYDVPLSATATDTEWNVLLDTVVAQDEHYMGSGNKTGFLTYRTAAKLLTIRDQFGHRIYRNLSEVAGDMGLSSIVKVPTELFPTDVLMIVLDLADYNFGTDRGGEITLFDDFDIDFNQYKYLMETYLSGALTLPYSAQIFKRVDTTDAQVTPQAPTFAGNVVTIPTQTGVRYRRTDTRQLLANGATITLDDTVLPIVEIEAEPASDAFYFGTNDDRVDTFTFEYDPNA